MVCLGKATLSYDISDYQDVDNAVGSLDSWRSLMAAAKARNLKVAVPNLYHHVRSIKIVGSRPPSPSGCPRQLDLSKKKYLPTCPVKNIEIIFYI